MRENIKGEYFDFTFLISCFAAWLMTAAVLTVISSVLLYELGCSEKSLGIVSSVITFLAAAAAGRIACLGRKNALLYTAIISAAALVTALLTIGFLIDGAEIEPSAVLSVISFSFAGSLTGAALCQKPGKGRKKYRPKL